MLTGQTHFDPQGVDVGFQDPFPPPGEESSECVEYDPSHAPNEPVAAGLIPDGNSAKCIVDGIQADCQSIGSHTMVQCPDNDCGPRVARVDIRFNGDRRPESYSALTGMNKALKRGNKGMFRLTYATIIIGFLIAVRNDANCLAVDTMATTKSETCAFPRLGPYRIHGKHTGSFSSFFEFQLRFRQGENQYTAKNVR